MIDTRLLTFDGWLPGKEGSRSCPSSPRRTVWTPGSWCRPFSCSPRRGSSGCRATPPWEGGSERNGRGRDRGEEGKLKPHKYNIMCSSIALNKRHSSRTAKQNRWLYWSTSLIAQREGASRKRNFPGSPRLCTRTVLLRQLETNVCSPSPGSRFLFVLCHIYMFYRAFASPAIHGYHSLLVFFFYWPWLTFQPRIYHIDIYNVTLSKRTIPPELNRTSLLNFISRLAPVQTCLPGTSERGVLVVLVIYY